MRWMGDLSSRIQSCDVCLLRLELNHPIMSCARVWARSLPRGGGCSWSCIAGDKVLRCYKLLVQSYIVTYKYK